MAESRGEQPSMEGVEEQQDGADADHAAQDERIAALAQVDPLDQAVHGWKTVWEGSESRAQHKQGCTNKPPRLDGEMPTLPSWRKQEQ